MSVIALSNYEESALRIYQKTSTVSIISEQPSYMPNTTFWKDNNAIQFQEMW